MTDRSTDADLCRMEERYGAMCGDNEPLDQEVLALIAEVRERRAARTLSDEDASWCEMVGDDARAFPLPTGGIAAAFRDHLLSALAIIDRITEEAEA